MAKKTFTTESLTTLVDEIKAYVLNAVSKKADSSHSHSISNITNLQKTLDEKDTAIEEAKIEASNQDAVVLLEAQRYIDTVADSKADATHGHEIADVNGLKSALDNKANNELATETANGIMSASDKKELNSISGDTNLGNFRTKTIADLLTAIDSWLDTNSNIANASAYFIADKSWITGWNSGDTSATITGGDTWTITNVAPYPSKTYTQLRISYYVNKEVYYVHRYNGTWGNVYQAAFKEDVDKKQDTITGAATTITGSNLTASRALISNGSGKVAVSDVTSTELGYLDGVTSNIQVQLDGKATILADMENFPVSYGFALSSIGNTIGVGNGSDNYYMLVDSNNDFRTGTQLNGSSAVKWVKYSKDGHTHDDRYYTETEVDSKLDGKSDTSHTHNYAGSSSAGGAANSAVKLETARNINGMSVDGSANRINYGTCSTATGTAAKTVDCTGFSLVTGAEITVKFATSNAAANPTLNVNSTGAKPIFYRGAAIDKSYLAANRTYTFRYDGTNWDLVGDINTDTNTDTKVTQTNTTSSGDYRVLFSGTADNTSRAETARKSANLTYNPSTGTLSATEFLSNGNKVLTAADFTVSDDELIFEWL